MNYALLNLIAYAPEKTKLNKSLKRDNIKLEAYSAFKGRQCGHWVAQKEHAFDGGTEIGAFPLRVCVSNKSASHRIRGVAVDGEQVDLPQIVEDGGSDRVSMGDRAGNDGVARWGS